MSKLLVNAFNIKPKNINQIKDYDIFSDKEELDELKTTILEEILDNNNQIISKELISTKLDMITKNMNLSSIERNYLYNLIDNEVNGYGPLTEIINDASVKSILVNKPNEIYIETSEGFIKDDSISFINDDHILKTVKRLATLTNNEVNFDKPVINFNLNQNKFQVMLSPVVDGISLIIKKANHSISTLEDLVRIGTLTPYMARYLEAAVLSKLNILICGHNYTGKTNLLECLINVVLENKRIYVINSDEEITLEKANFVKLIPNDYVNVYKLVKNEIRDYTVISRIDSDNILDSLVLMNNSCGVLTTMNTKFDSIKTIKNNIKLVNSKLDDNVIDELLSESIDLVVYLKQTEDKSRKVVRISEYTNDGLKDIFTYKDNEFELLKYKPYTYEIIKNNGIDLSDMFGGN